MIKQRTPEWYEARRGKFSASDITRILGTITHKKTKDAIDLYAMEKAVEHLYGVEDEPKYLPENLKRGIEHEPLAFVLFQELKAKEFIDVQEVGFEVYCNHSGASSDGKASNNFNLEIKCPRRVKYFEIVAKGLDAVEQKHIDQMQMQMLCNDTEASYFVNYLLDKGVEHIHELIVERDDEHIELIKERLDIVIDKKLEYISLITDNRQQ